MHGYGLFPGRQPVEQNKSEGVAGEKAEVWTGDTDQHGRVVARRDGLDKVNIPPRLDGALLPIVCNIRRQPPKPNKQTALSKQTDHPPRFVWSPRLISTPPAIWDGRHQIQNGESEHGLSWAPCRRKIITSRTCNAATN